MVRALLVVCLFTGCAPHDANAQANAHANADADAHAHADADADAEGKAGGTFRFAAATADGVGIFDAATGRAIVRAPALPVDDLVLDPERGRLLTFELDADDEMGRVVARSFWTAAGWGLGAPLQLAAVDGIARLLPVPSAVVAFEDAYGPRWHVLVDGRPRASLPAPMPRAVWSSGDQVHALTQEPDASWTTRSARATESGFHATTAAPVPGLVHESARAVALAAGVVAIDVVGGALVLRLAERTTPVPVAVAEIADARAISPTRAAILAGGPTRLIVVELGSSGSVSFASLRLDEPTRADPRFLSRALVAVGAARVLVATAVRVHAVDVGPELQLLRDASFRDDGARAPIDGPLR
ncbi:MAG: hypothetical protein HYV09_27990 [Deltaproteobacteria bacterium]|nr:hypothetical protein [Deltaproteobacteria bacterium]